MQKFNYHCHTNFKNIFDGRNSTEEMISTAEDKGFHTVGISNHFIYHPTIAQMPYTQKQNFSNINKLIDLHKESFDEIDKMASQHKIKVLKGLEVDFFPSLSWRKDFEKMIKELKPDYMIGSTHFIRNRDESFMCGIYFLNTLPPSITKEDMQDLVSNYWQNVELSIQSGYFDFIAHPDYCCQFNLGCGEKWLESKMRIIEALSSGATVCEINTGGLRRIGRPFPDWWMIEEMVKQNIPLLISDGAHCTKDIGSFFEEVEEKLRQLNCQNRFSFNK